MVKVLSPVIVDVMTSDASAAEVEELTIVDLGSSQSLTRRRRTTLGSANVGVMVRARVQGDAEVMLRLGIEMGLVTASVASGSTIQAVRMLPMYFPITANYTIGSASIDNGAFVSSALAVHANTFVGIDTGQVTGASLSHVAPEPVGVLTYRLFVSDIAAYTYARRVQLNMTVFAATGVLDVPVGGTLYSPMPIRDPETDASSQKATESESLVWVLVVTLAFLLCLLPITVLVVHQRSKRKQERIQALSYELSHHHLESPSPPTNLFSSQHDAKRTDSSPADDGEYLQLAGMLLDLVPGVVPSTSDSPAQPDKSAGLLTEDNESLEEDSFSREKDGVPLELDLPGLNNWDEQLPAPSEATLSGKYVTDEFMSTLSSMEQEQLRKNCQGSLTPVSGIDKMPLGIHARHASDYHDFSVLFSRIMADYHGIGNNFVHTHSWDLGRPTTAIGGPLLDMSSTPIRSAAVKVKASRNFSDLPLSPAMQLEDRISLENRMVEVFSDRLSGLTAFENGAIYSLTPGSPHFVDNARYVELVASRQIFARPPISPELGCIGTLGDDWPAGRCCFVSNDSTFMVWVGGEDHVQIIVQSVTESYMEPYTRMQKVVDMLETRTGGFAQSDKFGWITACPSRLGSALSSQTCVELPLLEDADFDAACHVCSTRGVTLRCANGAHMFELVAQEALCMTEGEMICNVWDAMLALSNEYRGTSGAAGGSRVDKEPGLTAPSAALSADLLGQSSHYHPESASAVSPTPTPQKKTRKLFDFTPAASAVLPSLSPKKARKLFDLDATSVSPKATPEKAWSPPVQNDGEEPLSIISVRTTTPVESAWYD